MSSNIRVALALAIATTSCVVTAQTGDTQFTPGPWIRISSCGADGNLHDVARADVPALAELATRVKMCTRGSTVDCVTSVANSWPIENLRSGLFLLSHQKGQLACNGACVRDTWQGPRLANLWNTCGNQDHENQDAGAWIYWACNNGGGMHWDYSGNKCGWTSAGGSQLELFIDAGSESPTMSPTMSPVFWYESAGHKANITELQTSVGSLIRSVESITTHLGTDIEGTKTIEQMFIELTVKVDTMSDLLRVLVPNVTELQSQINDVKATTASTTASLQTQVTQLKSALKAAVADTSSTRSCAGAACAPNLSSEGDILSINSIGSSVQLQTSKCVDLDLCDATSFANRLKDALSNL